MRRDVIDAPVRVVADSLRAVRETRPHLPAELRLANIRPIEEWRRQNDLPEIQASRERIASHGFEILEVSTTQYAVDSEAVVIVAHERRLHFINIPAQMLIVRCCTELLLVCVIRIQIDVRWVFRIEFAQLVGDCPETLELHSRRFVGDEVAPQRWMLRIRGGNPPKPLVEIIRQFDTRIRHAPIDDHTDDSGLLAPIKCFFDLLLSAAE